MWLCLQYIQAMLTGSAAQQGNAQCYSDRLYQTLLNVGAPAPRLVRGSTCSLVLRPGLSIGGRLRQS